MTNNHDDIERLLRLAGPREAVSSERMFRVKATVHRQWQAQLRTRARKRAIGWALGALATAAMFVIGFRVVLREDVAPVDLTRTVAEIDGSGEELRSGSVIDSPLSYTAFRLAGGALVRLDKASRVRIISSSAIGLDRGAAFIDSDRATGPFEILTTFGVVRDVGTRFEVRLSEASLRVRVRDGLVQVEQNRQRAEAKPGEELTLHAAGSVLRRNVAVYGPEWDWTFAAAPPFDIEGRSLREFLDWISWENGWQLRFADGLIDERSKTTILHGSIAGLTAHEALAAVLPASGGVQYQLDRGVLLIASSSTR